MIARALPSERPISSTRAASRPSRWIVAAITTVAAVACASLASTSAAPDATEWRPLFDGRTLDGWANVNTDPGTWSVARDEDGGPIIRCTGKPTGLLRTDRMYENFELELEWKHLKEGGNAGVFVWSDPFTAQGTPFARSIEVQVLDLGYPKSPNWTPHGDLFAIHGARCTPERPHPAGWMRCLPSEERVKPHGEWNHYRVVCRDGEVRLSVNGKEVSRVFDCSPRRGYICLESEGSEVWFRNLRIRELPASETPLAPEMIANEAEGFRPLYGGVSLDGWKVDEENAKHWQARDWRLHFDGKGSDLWSTESFRDFELIADWRWVGDPQRTMERPVILPDGSEARDENGAAITETVEERDSGIYLRGSSKSQVNIWCWPVGSGEVYGYRTDQSMPADVRAGVTPSENADRPIGQWNRFRIRMVGDRLTVVLNGRTVIDDARLPGVAEEGPIALQSHGSAIEFASIAIREIE